jgi:hypothetical protein
VAARARDGRLARLLPLGLAVVLAAEIALGLARHRSAAELADAAAGGDVRERGRALYVLASRGDGSAATPELREAALEADPRLAVLVAGVLEDGTAARLRRRALVADAPSPETARYLGLMFERARSHAQYRELLSGDASPREPR